jgi:hypothetical protein
MGANSGYEANSGLLEMEVEPDTEVEMEAEG